MIKININIVSIFIYIFYIGDSDKFLIIIYKINYYLYENSSKNIRIKQSIITMNYNNSVHNCLVSRHRQESILLEFRI